MNITEDKLIFTYKGRGTSCPNKYYYIDDNTIAIKATDKNGTVIYGIIDSEDFDKVKICNWKIRRDCLTYYLCNSTHGFLHRLILNPDKEKQIDHIDGNGLNNKKSNLRIVTGFENSRNKHYVSGIYFDDTGGHLRFRVKWSDDEGKSHIKDFAKSTYQSLDEAYQQAKEFRIKIETNVYKNYRYFESLH